MSTQDVTPQPDTRAALVEAFQAQLSQHDAPAALLTIEQLHQLGHTAASARALETLISRICQQAAWSEQVYLLPHLAARVSEMVPNQTTQHALLSRSVDTLLRHGMAEHAERCGELILKQNIAAQVAAKPQRRLIAYSLFGDQPIYCETMILNAEIAPSLYPGWILQVYHDASVPAHVLSRLAAAGVELIAVHTLSALSSMPGTFWRFLALEDQNADVVLLRDADSILSERERVLVDLWLNSDRPFHIIRDWYGHTDLILAGLWGARQGLLGHIRTLITDYLAQTPQLHPTHADQYFLARCVWPRIARFALHHSSIYDVHEARWPEQLPRIAGSLSSRGAQQLGAWQASTYQVQDSGTHYNASIYEGNRLVCQYQQPMSKPFEIPKIYRERIDAGRYRLQFLPYTVEEQPPK